MTGSTDVVRALIDQTKSGELVWRSYEDKSGWSVDRCDCTFVLHAFDLKLEVAGDFHGKRQGVTVAENAELVTLVDVLSEMFPFPDFKQLTKEEGTLAALECLKDTNI